MVRRGRSHGTPTGVQTMTWLLRAVAEARVGLVATTRWDDFRAGSAGLFLWEAFASNRPGKMPDEYDAMAIVQAFLRWVECGNGKSAITAPHPVSLAGMAILWAGLSKDQSLLQEPCIVVKVDYGMPGK